MRISPAILIEELRYVPIDLGNVSLQIFSTDGRLARQYPALPGTREISVAALPPGL